jgi:TPR repeat protein
LALARPTFTVESEWDALEQPMLFESASGSREAACREFELAAARGSAQGQFEFGRCLEMSSAAGLERAAQNYKLAADQGNADAQHAYASCLEHGTGVRADPAAAAEYYRLAAQRRHPKAQ